MLDSVELREQARRYRQTANNESTPQLKQMLTSHALALAQLAERVERREAAQNEHLV